MVCNTGVSLTPVVNGEVHHFQARGLYNGLFLMWDRESESYWNHITGQSVYGPLAGTKLEVGNLLHTAVEQALAADPDLRVALSDQMPQRRFGRRGRGGGRIRSFFDRVPVLRGAFRSTIDKEDTRRPTMDIGLGVWADSTARYYAMEFVTAHDNMVLDEFQGRRLLVYREPTSHVLVAQFTDATTAEWRDDELHLNTGEVIRKGVLFGAGGEKREVDYPQQVFTRWYGFALTFPGAEVYEP
ncbi:MAG: DUF3179 domain-containing (seleno)protein [Gemmatimonadales bacterium]